jgi:hypothetical protein
MVEGVDGGLSLASEQIIIAPRATPALRPAGRHHQRGELHAEPLADLAAPVLHERGRADHDCAAAGAAQKGPHACQSYCRLAQTHLVR